MRHLTQPATLKMAASAALITTGLCYPRLALWIHRPHPLWYLMAILFLGATVFWGFVFAWHTRYSGLSVFYPKVSAPLWLGVALASFLVAALLQYFLDPVLRLTTPQDYPANLQQWFAMTLFHLAFVQLFLIFAPFAWSLRLFQNQWMAVAITTLFGVLVLLLKSWSSKPPVAPSLFMLLLFLRLILGLLAVILYLRGGAILVWGWALAIESRHLLDLTTP